jgi:hypothetical protein
MNIVSTLMNDPLFNINGYINDLECAFVQINHNLASGFKACGKMLNLFFSRKALIIGFL